MQLNINHDIWVGVLSVFLFYGGGISQRLRRALILAPVV